MSLQNKNYSSQSSHATNQRSQQPLNLHERMKVDNTFKNLIPFKEKPQRSFSAFRDRKAEIHVPEFKNGRPKVEDAPEKHNPFF